MKTFNHREGVPGFRFAGVASGIKNKEIDLGLIVNDKPCAAAGVFTRNRVQAAPVAVCKKRIRRGRLQAVLANSGNANACTGEAGIEAAESTCAALASSLGISPTMVGPCSTGVIGVPLPTSTLTGAVPHLVQSASSSGVSAFASSIMTTDKFPKIVALKETVGGQTIRLCGIAKGAGMIRPDMATMLAFIVTDALADPDRLKPLLRQTTDSTFNRISVDGDMSTNDTVLVLAGGRAQVDVTAAGSPAREAFAALLYASMQELSLMIVKDGEGATKLITVRVVNARNVRDARKAACQVADSLLVKTAFFGEDFNWGRIMMALGSSGAVFAPDRVAIAFNDVAAVVNGKGVTKNATRLKKIMKNKSIRITADLKSGRASHEVTTCDLSYEYVKINAEYTT